jgi:hypothetical protein
MTFADTTMAFERTINFTGAVALLAGLIFGAAMFIVQSL